MRWVVGGVWERWYDAIANSKRILNVQNENVHVGLYGGEIE